MISYDRFLKLFKNYFLVVFVSLILLQSFVFGQTNQWKYQMIKVAPDLEVGELTVFNVNNPQVGNKMRYNIVFIIKNTGSSHIARDFYVSVQQKVPGSASFSNTGNCYKIENFGTLKKKKFVKSMYLNVHWVSNKTLPVRLWVDSGCNREITLPGIDINELNENNNYSNVVSVGADFSPHVNSVSPKNPCLFYYYDTSRGKLYQPDLALLGSGFGTQQGNYGIGIKPAQGGKTVAARIKKWHDGMIYFNIARKLPLGKYHVFIMNKNDQKPVSNFTIMNIAHKTKIQWRLIRRQWDTFYKNMISIYINNWSGKKNGYFHQLRKDSSKITMSHISEPLVFSPITMHVKRIGTYGFLVNKINSEGETFLSRSGNKPLNHLYLTIPFESNHVEVKGFFRRLKAKIEKRKRKFHDIGCPDVEINNLKVIVELKLSYGNRRLNFVPDARILATVKLHDRALNHLANEFSRGWNSKVKSEIEKSINASIKNNSLMGDSLRDAFMTLLAQVSAHYKRKYVVTNIEFDRNHIDITYYNPE